MNYNTKTPAMSKWAEEDQPREKLMSFGRNTISDTEMLSIIIGSGTQKQTAFDISKLILSHFNYDLSALKNLHWKDLTIFPGIGPVKAINIIASLEFGKRIYQSETKVTKAICSSDESFQIIRNKFSNLEQEEFWIILMNRANKVISKERISIGGVSSTLVDPKIVFKKALRNLASYIILVHNHPSGNLKPSMADIDLTKNLVQAAEFLEIGILDHLIIADDQYFSFADNGMI